MTHDMAALGLASCSMKLMCSSHRGLIAVSLVVLQASAHDCMQALLKKAGKPSVLGFLEENDPDAADDEDDEAGFVATDEAHADSSSSSVVDKVTDLLGKTGLTSK